MNKKALFIAYFYPPLAGSGVYRSLKFSKYLNQYDYTPTIIATNEPPLTWNYSDISLCKEIPESIPIIRILDPYVSYSRQIMLDSITSDDYHRLDKLLEFIYANNFKAKSLYKLYKADDIKVIGKIIKFQWTWALQVIDYIESQKLYDQFDLIYTTSGPDSAHIIGLYFKMKYGIRWIADFRDEWITNPYFQFDLKKPVDKLYYYLEKIIVESADRVICVAEPIRDHYVETYGIEKSKIVSITNGYDEKDFVDLDFSLQPNDKFTITYSGILNTSKRSMEPIFESVIRLSSAGKIDINKVRINIVGTPLEAYEEKINQYNLAENVTCIDYCSHHEALQHTVDADVLILLIGDDQKYSAIYSGKIFDYLRSGRPILAIAPYGGVVDELLTKTGQGCVMQTTEPDKIDAYILDAYRKWEYEEERTYSMHEAIKLHERSYLTGKLAKVFDEIISSTK